MTRHNITLTSLFIGLAAALMLLLLDVLNKLDIHIHKPCSSFALVKGWPASWPVA
jgi:hypothetical protein